MTWVSAAATGIAVTVVGGVPTTAHGAIESSGTVRDGVVRHDRARVLRVVDGDTIKVQMRSGAQLTVRLLGIDAPAALGECWGYGAWRAARRLLPVKMHVRLISDPSQANKDRYGRLLRYVAKGRTDVNRELVARGHAKVYVYKNNPFRRIGKYEKAESDAKVHARGVWGNCNVATTPTPTLPPPPPPPPLGDDLDSYPPASTYACPTNAPIKGNESSMIYHPPESPWYAITTPEQCFASEAGAVAHGFRRAKY